MFFTFSFSCCFFLPGDANKSPLDAYSASLSIVLKDHKSAEAIALSRESYENVIKEAAAQQGYDLISVKVTEGEDYSVKPADFIITSSIDVDTKDELLIALQQIKFTGLDLKLINLSGEGKRIFISIFY